MADSHSASVVLDVERTIGEISPMLFGGFAEHLGRCIYGGIYEPASPHAREDGLRRDVLAALGELNFSHIRYPGGNFVSAYHWQDGVGPRALRPRRRELVWQAIETNQFGLNEFMEFCRALSTEPMLGLNFGTGTLDDAANLVEYCNAPGGTLYADLRAAHGYREPHRVKYWCLGNEMDGPWQMGRLDAEAYACRSREAAKMMKQHDASLQLTLCGSSGPGMPTFPEWDRQVLEIAWEQANYLSLHYYADNRENDLASYLALTAQFEDQVDTLAAVLRYVKAKLRSKHTVYLSWDEWNIWYKDMTMGGGWTEAPHQLEEIYNLEDALVAALWLNVFLRKCDVLKMACLAQIVNVIAPILTTPDRLVKQTIFYPFRLFRQFARGLALEPSAQSPRYATRRFGDMPLLDVSASYDPADGQSAVFLVNRSQAESLPVEITWRGAAPKQVFAAHQLTGSGPKAANTFEQPNTIVPVELRGMPVVDGKVTLGLPPLSLTVLAAK